LGLQYCPNVGDNGVHASASPFEALAERMNWLKVEPETVYIYVCIYVYIQSYVSIYVYMPCIHKEIHMHIYLFIHVYTYICILYLGRKNELAQRRA
jgi:hypothetical protein